MKKVKVSLTQLRPTLCSHMDCSPPGCSVHRILQGVFPTQGWSPGLLHCRQILCRLSHQGSPQPQSGPADTSGLFTDKVTGLLLPNLKESLLQAVFSCPQACRGTTEGPSVPIPASHHHEVSFATRPLEVAQAVKNLPAV